MTTAFSRVVAAFVDTLEASPAVCDHVYRARDRVIPDQIDRAVAVQFEGAMPQRGAIAGAPVDWIVRIAVDCLARGVSESGDILVDPLLEAVYRRLATDMTLSGFADDIGEPSIEAENSAEGKKTGWVRLTYAVEVRTANLTLA